MKHFLCFLACFQLLWGADYDCVFIGSSPIALFEALYQYHLGNSVAIFEEAPQCGGAWKSLTLCGVEHVDVGCHEIGEEIEIKEFLEEYAGCHIISMDNPSGLNPLPHPHPGFYFANGCYELIRNLELLISRTSIALHLESRVDHVAIHRAAQEVRVTVQGKQFTTKKVFASQYSYFSIEGYASTAPPKTCYHHLYLLIADPTPARFSYHDQVGADICRTMNLTHFTGLVGTGQQLIVLQVRSEKDLQKSGGCLEALKKHMLIDESAYFLKAESYVYKQWPHGNFGCNDPQFLEVLNTAAFWNLPSFIPKWKGALRPFRQQ